MTETRTVQVNRVYIKASAQQVWDAITQPEWTARYGYGGFAEYDLRPGGAHRTKPTQEFIDAGFTTDLLTGEVLEADPPRKLAITWKLLMDPSLTAEPFTTLTFDVEETQAAGVRLTITHDVTGAPNHAALVSGQREDVNAKPGESAGGGWAWVLSDLKSVLETGQGIAS
jgi:uncharacterized protein YndB with AHSA1/START domain